MVDIYSIVKNPNDDDLNTSDDSQENTQTNLIHIYLLNNSITDDTRIDLSMPANTINKIKNRYKQCKITNFQEYYKNELIYQYDLSNDNQIVYSRFNIKNIKADNIYIVSYFENKYPSHLFPCLNTIDNISEFTLREFKVTNRLSVIIKEENATEIAYIEYKHSNNVELDKIQSCINNILKNI